MSIFGTLWDAFWFFFWMFALFAYLMTMFSVVGDLFRDRALAGWAKAIWFLALFFVPFLTVLAYVIVRGDGMAERSTKVARARQESAEAYVREVAGTSPAEEIARAKGLLDAGTITVEEYEGLKAKALA